MNPLATLGLVLGASFSCGLNLYATVVTLGLLERFGLIHLPDSMKILANPAVLAVAIALYVIEFFADKVPYLDTIWDAVHTFIRPPAAAVLAFTALGDAPAVLRVVAALLAGGVALTSHGAKASSRAAVNASPEPLSNWFLSLGEDALAVLLTWLAATHPILTAVLVAALFVLAVILLWKLFGFLRRAWARLFGTGARKGA